LDIREATAEDADSISALCCELSAKFITHEFTAVGVTHLLASMQSESIEKYIRSGFKYHVAVIDNQVVGVVGIRDNSHLYHLFVAEKYQRKGIAKKLWQLAMDACLSRGSTGEFTVNSSEYARGVYEQLGFIALSGPEEKNGVVYIPMKLENSVCLNTK